MGPSIEGFKWALQLRDLRGPFNMVMRGLNGFLRGLRSPAIVPLLCQETWASRTANIKNFQFGMESGKLIPN